MTGYFKRVKMAWNKTKAVVLYVVLLAALYGSFEPGPATSYSGGGFMPLQRSEPPPLKLRLAAPAAAGTNVVLLKFFRR